MRTVMIACGIAFGVVGATLLPACGDSDDGPEFCRDGAATLSTLWTVDLDPSSTEFEDAVDTLEGVDPPARIADDWDALMDVLVALRDAESLGPAELQAVYQRFGELDEERTRIDSYVRREC